MDTSPLRLDRGELSWATMSGRWVEGGLPWGGGDEVLAADDVRQAHRDVVDAGGEQVERVAVAAGQREVRDVGVVDGDLAAHHVAPGRGAVGHPEAQHRRPALGLERGLLLVG